MAGEWQQQALEEVAELSGGFAFKSEDYSADGRFVLRTLNIKDDGSIHRDDAVFLPLEKCDLYKRFELQEHDTLFVMVGATLGKVGYVRRKTLPALLNQNMWRIRGRDGLCDKRYLQYAFRHTVVKNLGWASGSARDFVRRDDYRTMEIPVPPLAEQRAIASVLGALDDKIELNRRMNATLEAMARALFQSWFVDFDPVRAKQEGRKPTGMDDATAALFPDSFRESPIGPIPHEWSIKDFGEIADFDKGLSYKGEGLAEEGGVPMVNLGCFTGRGVFNADRVKRYTGEYRERHLIRAGDLVVANTDMTQNRVIIGSPALVPELNGVREFLFTHHVFAVRFKLDAQVWRRYVFFTLLKPEFREIAEGFSTGTTVLALPRDGLLRYRLCLPPSQLLEAFEKQVGPQLAAVDANLHQSRTLATLRDTLLPKLLSGELRVPDAERVVSAVA
jgi:type I restriction enzyme S subunit